METEALPTNEDHIRHYAYMLWLEEGQPEGRAEEHWSQACFTAEAKEEAPSSATASKDDKKAK